MIATLQTYEEIASYIPGCKLADDGRFENNDSGAQLVMECGARFDVCQNGGQLHISPRWPEHRRETIGPWHLHPRPQSPNIHVSTAKKPEVIAREIQRRFLTQFLEIWRQCMVWIGNDLDYEKVVTENAEAVASVMALRARKSPHASHNSCALSLVDVPRGWTFDGEFEASYREISCKLRGLTREQAVKLAQFLTTLK